MFSHVGHDPDARELHVKYRSGLRYVLKNVSAEQYQSLCDAGSIGAHFQKHFGGYQIRRFKEE